MPNVLVLVELTGEGALLHCYPDVPSQDAGAHLSLPICIVQIDSLSRFDPEGVAASGS
jgi:hypothetical protein